MIKDDNPSTDKMEGNTHSNSLEIENIIKKESQVEQFTKQQQLINQFMHLNIQLLSKKL